MRKDRYLKNKDERCRAPVMVEQTLDTFGRYADAPQLSITGRCILRRSLTKMNLNLMLMGTVSGIDDAITTKFARRFFRQSLSDAGIREPQVVKTMMGHTISNDIDTHYLLVSDNMLRDAKKELEEYFNSTHVS
jgi:integrase